MITTRYDDGDIDTRPANQVKPYNWHPGTRIECNYQGAGQWFAATISAMSGSTGFSITYDNGTRENTITGRCRSR